MGADGTAGTALATDATAIRQLNGLSSIVIER